MWITRLTLVHFRNYAQEEVRPSPGANVFLGGNAQGKSNLIEAITLLSTTRSFRATADRPLISWSFLDEPIVHARLTAEVEGSSHRRIDIVIAQQAEADESGLPCLRLRKFLRLDDVPHRLVDALGVLPTVLFTPEDVTLVAGPPADRRRFLDVLLCQASRDYCRALSLYNRSLSQRNHLLRLIRQRRTDPDQLYYWDRLLAENGALVARQRAEAVAAMSEPAARTHAELANGESLTIAYEPGTTVDPLALSTSALAREFQHVLERSRQNDLERGVTTVGPHRDDIEVQVGGVDAAAYASRGQMRTAALTLRLVEGDFLEHRLGQRPILLFDDVMSELDAERRRALEEVMMDSSQSFITGLDAGPFSRSFLRAARVFTIRAARVEPISAPGEDAAPPLPPDEGTPPVLDSPSG